MISGNVESAAAMGAVVKGNIHFPSMLYPAPIEANDQANDLVMSLFSVSSVLAMAYLEAKGKTREEMKRDIFFPSVEEVNLGYQELFSKLNSSHNFTLDIANCIFVQDMYPFLNTYTEQLKTFFLAEPQVVEFTNSEEARKTINAWVEQKTHNKIKNIIPVGTIDFRTRAVLVNVVYFKGKWAVPFDKRNTQAGMFHVSSTHSVNVEMMRITGKYKGLWSEELRCTVLDMPYEGGRLSMLFFLSHEPEGFDEMEKKLYSIDMSSISSGKYRHVYVAIPRFTVETTHQLVQPLEVLGLFAIFDKTKADFSGMTGKKDFYVSYAVQKTFIEVNEEGSEAAAFFKKTFRFSKPGKFICDRPFLFAIKDNLSGMILFNGRVVNPAVQPRSNSPKDTSSGAGRFLGLVDISDCIYLGLICIALKRVQ